MMHDYESMGLLDFNRPRRCDLLETYSGPDIVQWYGRIERQLRRMKNEAEQGKNFPAQEKLQGFLNVWRDNQITGSINVEQLTPLAAASDMLALDNNEALASYFGSLRDNLRKLIASEEALPRGAEMDQNEPLAGGGGVGRGGPPMSPEFGPEDMPPGEEGQGPEDQQPGGPQPGAEGTPEESPGDVEGEAIPEPEADTLSL